MSAQVYYEEGYGFVERMDENGYVKSIIDIEDGIEGPNADLESAMKELIKLRPLANGRFDADVVAAICAFKLGRYEESFELGSKAVEVAQKVEGFNADGKLGWGNIFNRPYIRALGIAGAALCALDRKSEAKPFFDQAKKVFPGYEMNTSNALELMGVA